MATRSSRQEPDRDSFVEGDALTCSICFVRKASLTLKMCPHCSKLYHSDCIDQWLKASQTCPHCRQSLSVNKPIICRWAEDLLQQMDDLQQQASTVGKICAANKNVSTEKEKYAYKIVIIGDMGVGKTALLRRFASDDFTLYRPTVAFDTVHRKVSVDGDVVRLVLVDTAGQERFDTITTSFYRGADAIMIAYAVNDMNSFMNVGIWYQKAMANTDEDKQPIIVLVATKVDSTDDRVVSFQIGQEMSTYFGMKFLETSAKTRVNVDEIFFEMASALKAKQDEEMEKHFQTSSAFPANKTKESTLKLEPARQQKRRHNSGCACVIS